MPPLPPAARVLRVVYEGHFASARWANVMHVQGALGSPNQTDINTIAQDMQNAWTQNLAAIVVSQSVLDEVIVTDLSSNTGLVGTAPSGSTGSHSGITPMSANVAVCISWKIARHYRGGHPRTYLCGIDQTEITPATLQTWVGTFQNLVTSRAQSFLAAVNGFTTASTGQLTMGQLSYYAQHQLRPTPQFDAITTGSCDARVDTQRRRLGRDVPG